MELVVEPRLVSRKRYSSLLVVLVMIAMADAFGLIGILHSPPLAAAIQLIVGEVLKPETAPSELESLRRIANLDERVEEVYRLVARMDDKPNPEALNMLDRVGQLITRANELVTEQKEKEST